MIGKMLGNRYEIIQKIGTGGMSVVYKAKCHLLNRFVAVKILRQEFIDNADFIKRFKVESQAAASLSHPNIVSIYDVGNEGDIYYIVMEFVDGITLKDYIVKRKILDWREAVGIAVQICSALEAAHKNNIIHRDIKPHNIIITPDGVAKVTDFGIARAATYFTVTFAGNAIGSVHYFSPEQARGGYTDNRTDIYSLGVVMYEMLTGQLPFDGDSPVSIAFKHLQDQIVLPKDLNPSIPNAVNDIVLKAMSKELDSRYQSATSMLYDLTAALQNPNGGFVEVDSEPKGDSPTLVIPPVTPAKNRVEDINVKKNDKPKGKKDKLTLYAAIISTVILLSLLGFVGYRLGVPYITASSDATVPTLIGKSEDDARNMLAKLNLTLKVTDRRADDTVPPGVIIEQTPTAGITVKMPNEVDVVVSLGKKDVVVPYVEKKDYREAKAAIESAGLVPKLSYEASDTIPINFITRTNPTVGSSVKQGTEVELFISNGPSNNSFSMPNLIGKTEEQAKRILADNKLEYGQVNYQDNSAPYGTIISQSIAPNSPVGEGTSINLTLSTGSAKSVNVAKTKNLKISLPQDSPTVTVKVVLIDNNAQRTVVYQKTLNRTDSPVSVPVSGTGKNHIQVYFNGVLGAEQDINF